jgi:hypothetical protein
MTKMIYKKDVNSDPEVVWMLNAYKDHDGKFKAIIMRNYDISNAIMECPYVEVKLNKLRPLASDYNSIFCK